MVATTEVRKKQSLIQMFLEYLKIEEVDAIFGVPGGLLYPFFDAIERDEHFSLIVSKHEEGAAFMADGYARQSGRLAVCAGTSGPGSTNMLTGVGVAFSDGVPMLVLTGQAASGSLGKGAVQETAPEDIDIVSMFDPITKYSAMVTDPSRLLHHMRRALRLALTGRPGPVHLNIPIDFWDHEVAPEPFEPARYRPRTTVFDREAVGRAARRLAQATHPVILAGAGARAPGAREQLVRLAEQINARVITSPRGKGVFPEDHYQCMGVCGYGGHQQVTELMLGDQVDVLLAVGTSLNETTTFNWHADFMPSECFIHLDIDVDRIGRAYPVDIPLLGDAHTVLNELFFHVRRELERAPLGASWSDMPQVLCDERRYDEPELRASQATPITPQRWRVELQEALPDDALIYSDVGGHMLFNLHDLCIRCDQDFVLNLGFGSMGHGTVAPIGARLAHPERPIVSIIGDACFTMNGMEMLTAVEYQLPVIWIVEDNQMHGISWHISGKISGGRPLESIRYKRPIDVAAIGQAMGLQAEIVEAPGQLQGAVARALESGKPALITVRVDPEIPPPMKSRAKMIGGFDK